MRYPSQQVGRNLSGVRHTGCRCLVALSLIQRGGEGPHREDDSHSRIRDKEELSPANAVDKQRGADCDQKVPTLDKISEKSCR